jgi:hypothetical protein
MITCNRKIAVAVATALGLGGTAFAANTPPTPSQASAATDKVFMAGSSAAVNGVLAFIETAANGVCGNAAYSVFTTPTGVPGQPDFRAVSCYAANSTYFASGNSVTIWYRPEGGSVVGVFPIYNNKQINELNISAAGCVTTASNATSAAYNCTGVLGSTPANGTNDTFSGGVFSTTVDIGISDLEPGVFGNINIGQTHAWAGGGNNDPTTAPTYSSGFTGNDISVSALQGSTWSHALIFEQVFGFMVNTALGITDLPKQQLAAIFDLGTTDWNKVANGKSSSGVVSSATNAIYVCNRELGSGTRASTDVFLNGDGCNTVGSSVVSVPETGNVDNFATALEIDCVNSHANGIGYVSIDNYSKLGVSPYVNVNAISVSGVTATQLNAATGVYDYVYEASINKNNSASADGNTFYTAVVPILQAVNTTAKSGQVLAIPGLNGNTATIPLTTGSPSTEFTSLFNRGVGAGNSCTPLIYQGPN